MSLCCSQRRGRHSQHTGLDSWQGVKNLLTLLGTAVTGQGMRRITAKGPFAWDKVEGETAATFGRGPLETFILSIQRGR